MLDRCTSFKRCKSLFFAVLFAHRLMPLRTFIITLKTQLPTLTASHWTCRILLNQTVEAFENAVFKLIF